MAGDATDNFDLAALTIAAEKAKEVIRAASEQAERLKNTVVKQATDATSVAAENVEQATSSVASSVKSGALRVLPTVLPAALYPELALLETVPVRLGRKEGSVAVSELFERVEMVWRSGELLTGEWSRRPPGGGGEDDP